MATYGRVMGIYQWTIDNFEVFDGWCAARGVDPLELPAYRYYNLALHCLRENRTDDGLAAFEESLKKFDALQHPWLSRPLKQYKVVGKTEKKQQSGVVQTAVNEEEDAARVIGKKVAGATGGIVDAQVPSWWRGDQANYKIASQVAGQANTLKPS